MSGVSFGALAIASAMGLVAGMVLLLDSHVRYGGRQRRIQGARWARRADLRALRMRGPQAGRLVLGRKGRRLLGTAGRASVLVVGPTGIAHKTTGITIPAVLEWDGPVVVTSVKTDLLMATIGRREEMGGEAMIYDPTGVTGRGTVKATPLLGCSSWGGAMKVAHRLSSSAKASEGLEEADFWHAAAEKLLSPLLFAAANEGGQMADVIRWLNAGAEAEPKVREILAATGNEDALGAWRANWNRDERQRSSIYTTAETILRAFSDPRVLKASTSAEYTPDRLLDGRANTLYLCGSAHEQVRLRSLFAAMLAEVVGAVQERSARTGEPIDPPLLVVNDEAANSAPMPNYDVVASTGAGQGILLVTVAQDLSQFEARWGRQAHTIFNNHEAAIYCAGIRDKATLDHLSGVVGEGEYRQLSETAGEGGRGSSTQGSAYRALTPANVVREGRPGTGILLYGHLPPTRMDLRPWFKDPRLSKMVDAR
ncbi:MAG TPA: type IV secretory system conjugative DNA transfer family protein [Solirubrobacterales bacterium]|nr:type IV secretory system conjugative DNA transfer family protein [Solirubrobacterales bacterium]